MADILTQLWLNIDSFNYLNPSIVRTSNDDAQLYIKTKRKFWINTSLFLGATFLFSKYRPNLWMRCKNHFLGDRIHKLNAIKEQDRLEKTLINDPTQKIKIEYKTSNEDFDGPQNLNLMHSRKLRTRNKNVVDDIVEDTVKIPLQNPTFSEEYFGFMKKYRKNVSQLSVYNKFFHNIFNKKEVNEKGENFIMNTKFIYLPFLIFLIFSLYDLAVTYIALYFKYQPIVDEYYRQNKKE